MLLIRALTNVWMSARAGGAPSRKLFGEAFLVELALYLVTALGMQLMTFEDMTCELRRANTQTRDRRRPSCARWS